MKTFINKLEDVHLEDSNMQKIKTMLVGTYKGYAETRKEEHLNTIIKLSYMLGKAVGKEQMRKICSKNE